MENFLSEEFFEPKSPLMKHVYILHCFLGGACYENYITRKFAYLVRSFAIFAYSTIVLGNIMRFNRQESDFEEKEVSLGQLVFVHVWFTIALTAYMKRDNFHKLFDHMNEHERTSHLAGSRKSNIAQDEFKETSVEDFNFKVGKFFTIWMLVAGLAKLFRKVTTLGSGKEFQIDYGWDFVWSFPYTDSQTVTSYVLVFAITFSFFLFSGFIIYGSLVLPIILSIHLANQTKRLLNDMKYHTELAYACLEDCFRREQILMDSVNYDETLHHFELSEIERKRERHIREFMSDVNRWIGIHQKLVLHSKIFKECVSTILTIQTVGYQLGIVVCGYIVSKMVLDSKELNYDFIAYIGCDLILLLMACRIGNTHCKLSDDLTEAIYSMPWYYLPKPHQKVLLNFMCLAQKTDEIRIFDVFPLTLELYPTLLNDAYGYIQLSRVLEMKHTR